MKNMHFYCFAACIIFTLFNSELYAQTFYQYKYGSPSYDERTQKGVLHKGSIYMFTESWDRTVFTFNSTLRLVKFDSLMSVDFEKDFQFQGAMRIRSLTSATDSSLLGLGTTYDTINNLTSSILLHFKENGDTLWTRILNKPGENVILDYVTTIEDTLILFGTTGSFQGGNIATNASFVKVNRNTGHVISSSAFQFDSISNYMLGINCIFMPYDSMYYAICSVEDSITSQYSQTLSKFDRNFNCLKSVLISDSTCNNLFENLCSSLICNEDLILTTFTKCFVFHSDAFLCALDTGLNIQYAKQYGGSFSDHAFRDLHYNPFDSTYRALMFSSIVTLDNQGQVLSERRLINPPYSAMKTNSVLPLTDSTSVFISGYQQTNFQTFDVLIHISRNDGYGCLDASFFLPWQVVQMDCTPLSASSIPLSIQQFSNTQMLNQSAPIVLECIITSTQPPQKEIENIRAFPNPTYLQLHVQSAEFSIKQWQLLQPTGTILAGETISPQNEFEIDLSTVPAGAYILVLYPDSATHPPLNVKIMKL